MKYLNHFFAICLMLCISMGCDMEQIIPWTGITDESRSLDARKSSKADANPLKATGSVELKWKGVDKGSNKGNKPEDLLTFLDIVAIEGTAYKDAIGEIVFTVLETDLSPHREIIAEVLDAKIALVENKKKAWVVARVISDSKGCAGGGHSGHDDACGGSSDDHSSHDGGCSDDHTDDGACAGSDSGTDTHGASPGGEDKGNPLSGKNCRIGQIIALKMHDGGSPGMSRDGITWKWFDPNASFVPAIENRSTWPHLCKKEIIEGNLVVHLR